MTHIPGYSSALSVTWPVTRTGLKNGFPLKNQFIEFIYGLSE